MERLKEKIEGKLKKLDCGYFDELYRLVNLLPEKEQEKALYQLNALLLALEWYHTEAMGHLIVLWEIFERHQLLDAAQKVHKIAVDLYS